VYFVANKRINPPPRRVSAAIQSTEEIATMSKEKEETEKKEKPHPAKKSKYAGKGRPVTVPLMKLNVGDEVALEFTGEVRQQQIGKGKEPATVLRATDMDSGEVVDVIAPMVLISTLDREYPDDKGGVKGRKLLLKISRRPDKKYNDVIVSELD
jgi:hypothetical protein